ncbi:hypothetical protein N7326_06320 [Corynebacterium sp. ES2794-CONJ1]|uniref:GNAT family N-acetyltransferase n=1 Tax=unclassified Corynebacterium TaxID=2624378 RepID=UPI002166FF97|nr:MULTISPECIES: hypothetical protein [unclassified Corynebacterium]MCS4491980.1 hypothetical protein [Corynebacterium sp. ES2715-CONJ3]MCS4532084.1 hypothetical protein [Corynebacterium sp. ES2730-CONJ]MCU9519486.1 hypothetical protein [Corynebacterium sp. ES2794-CONJ1]
MTFFFAVDPLQRLSALELHEIYQLRADQPASLALAPIIDDRDTLGSTAHLRCYERINDKTVLAGAVRISSADNHFRLDHVIVGTAYRGGHILSDLLAHSLRFCYEQDPQREIVTQTLADDVDIYAELGFKDLDSNSAALVTLSSTPQSAFEHTRHLSH